MGKKTKWREDDSMREMEIQEAIQDGKIPYDVGRKLMDSSYSVTDYFLGIASDAILGDEKKKKKKNEALDKFTGTMRFEGEEPEQTFSFSDMVGMTEEIQREEEDKKKKKSSGFPFNEEDDNMVVTDMDDDDIPTMVDLTTTTNAKPDEEPVTITLTPRIPKPQPVEEQDEEEEEDETDEAQQAIEDAAAIFATSISIKYENEIGKLFVEDEYVSTPVSVTHAIRTNILDQNEIPTDADSIVATMSDIQDYIISCKYPFAIYDAEDFFVMFKNFVEINRNRYKFFLYEGYVFCYLVDQSFYDEIYKISSQVLGVDNSAGVISFIMGIAAACGTVHNVFPIKDAAEREMLYKMKSTGKFYEFNDSYNEIFASLLADDDDTVIDINQYNSVQQLIEIFNLHDMDKFESDVIDRMIDMRMVDEEIEEEEEEEAVDEDIEEEEIYIPRHVEFDEYVGKPEKGAPLDIDVDELESDEDILPDPVVKDPEVDQKVEGAVDAIINSFATAPDLPAALEISSASVSDVPLSSPNEVLRMRNSMKKKDEYGIERVGNSGGSMILKPLEDEG